MKNERQMQDNCGGYIMTKKSMKEHREELYQNIVLCLLAVLFSIIVA